MAGKNNMDEVSILLDGNGVFVGPLLEGEGGASGAGEEVGIDGADLGAIEGDVGKDTGGNGGAFGIEGFNKDRGGERIGLGHEEEVHGELLADGCGNVPGAGEGGCRREKTGGGVEGGGT